MSLKDNGKISLSRRFLDPIKNLVSVKSVYVEAVYLKALLYVSQCQEGTIGEWPFLYNSGLFLGNLIEVTCS